MVEQANAKYNHCEKSNQMHLLTGEDIQLYALSKAQKLEDSCQKAEANVNQNVKGKNDVRDFQQTYIIINNNIVILIILSLISIIIVIIKITPVILMISIMHFTLFKILLLFSNLLIILMCLIRFSFCDECNKFVPLLNMPTFKKRMKQLGCSKAAATNISSSITAQANVNAYYPSKSNGGKNLKLY